MNSLRGRLVASHSVVIGVCLLVVGGLALLLLARYQREITLDRMALQVRLLVGFVGDALDQGRTPAQISRLIEPRLGEDELESRLLLLDPDGVVVADTGGELVGRRLGWVVRNPQARPAETTTPLRATLTLPTGERWLYTALPVARAGKERFWALLAIPEQSGRRAFQQVLPRLALAGAVALVVSLLLVWLVARSLARPLGQIAQAAEAIADGSYDQRLDVAEPEEAHRLAQSFNRMARRVKDTLQSQRDFLANVSHELKTPLTSIQGFSQALVDRTAATPEAQAQAAGIIHAEAERMRRMVDDLLMLARLEAGQVEMQRQTLELVEILQSTVERFALRADSAGVALALEGAASAPVLGDPDRLAQVFDNLVDNALSHTPGSGRVALEVSVLDGGEAARGRQPAAEAPAVVVCVTDTGTGIPPQDLPRLFERFYQVDKSRPHSKSGAGLGLSIVREIVHAHGGEVMVESVQGLGTRVVVHLPSATPGG